MAQQKRQSNLYAAEDWQQVYESFAQINLTAYDFDTIRESMVNYLRLTYPDSFNDWIENDEFIFILDTIALIGQNLAFRMDLNSRENFLDTAERRASVLKLAKMISYAPKRAYPGRGMAKVMTVKTNQDIKNSFGQSLKNQLVRWNDPSDNNWYENFILVMNSVLIDTNQFGDPIKKVTINGVSNQLYQMNTIPMSAPNIPFTVNINGESMPFEVVNPDITSTGTVSERHPQPQEQKHIIYRNDGNGFDSPYTGFFVYFKQGNLSFTDFEYEQRIESRVQELNTNNINEIDVWVQEITDDGLVRTKWTRVPAIESISYNSVDRKQKNIFSVTTRDNDQITIKFPDARSGQVPRGSYRFWYRVSNGETYTIKTTDIQNKPIKYTYRTNTQSEYESSTLDIQFSLQFQSSLAQSRETIEQIKERAPQLYYTQNRFVNGEDYNIAPLMLGNTVLKAKAINRIYSGQSRFIDINDPTGKYQNTDVFTDDGAIYRDTTQASNSVLLPSTKSNTAIVIDSIQPLIGDNSVIQLYQDFPSNTVVISNNQQWTPEFNSSYSSNTYGKIMVGATAVDYDIGTIINFPSSTGVDVWTSVVDKTDDGYLILSMPIDNKQSASEFIKPFRVKFSNVEVQTIAAELDKKTDFVMIYDPNTLTWIPIEGTYTGTTVTYNNNSYPILINISYTSESWEFVSNGIDYIFVGGEKVRFYFVSTENISDISTGTVQSDKIDILSYNTNYTNNNGYTSDESLQIIETVNQENGYIDGSRVIVTSSSRDTNGIPLNPNQFRNIVPSLSGTNKTKYEQWLVFHENTDFTIDLVNTVSDDFTLLDSSWIYTLTQANAETIAYRKASLTRNVQMRTTSVAGLLNKGSGFVIGFELNGSDYFIEQTVGNNNDRMNNFLSNMTLSTDTNPITPEQAFKRAIDNMSSDTANESVKLDYYGYKDVSTDYFIKKDARVDINYHWKHYAPDDNRIDPSRTNLIDMYVLTSSYKDEVDIWLKQDNGSEFPKPPTSTELSEMFADVENRIVVSDSMIWHSATYLKLFGDTADADYRADFKVIKLPNSTLSDDEIRQKVISLTNDFFSVDNWDFGESFYYTELATYIHINLSTEIASVVIVPQNPSSKFGELFEIPSASDQLFVSTATVDNVIIVNSLAKSNINIGK
jgi:hypothetical protein